MDNQPVSSSPSHKVRVTCPRCQVSLRVTVARGESRKFIPRGVLCRHNLVIFIDRTFTVRHTYTIPEYKGDYLSRDQQDIFRDLCRIEKVNYGYLHTFFTKQIVTPDQLYYILRMLWNRATILVLLADDRATNLELIRLLYSVIPITWHNQIKLMFQPVKIDELICFDPSLSEHAVKKMEYHVILQQNEDRLELLAADLHKDLDRIFRTILSDASLGEIPQINLTLQTLEKIFLQYLDSIIEGSRKPFRKIWKHPLIKSSTFDKLTKDNIKALINAKCSFVLEQLSISNLLVENLEPQYDVYVDYIQHTKFEDQISQKHSRQIQTTFKENIF